MTPTDVVISGIGLVTPFGSGVPAFTDGFSAGAVALGSVTGRGSLLESSIAGQGPRPEAQSVPRKQFYLDQAVHEALTDARLSSLPSRRALVAFVGQAPWEPAPAEAGPGWDEFVGPATTMLARQPDAYLSHACASAAFAVGFARTVIRGGLADVALVAGSSVLNEYEYASMQVVRAISPSGGRPFDLDRNGISLGEGAGALVLERADHARRRGAAADVLLAGVAAQIGGTKPAASDPLLIERCMRTALADAQVQRLDHVHGHATGTPQGDAAELSAIEAVAATMELDELPVTSHKGAIGHLLHVSALPSIAAVVHALRTGHVPAVAGLSRPEPTRRVRFGRLRIATGRGTTAAVNSMGFGGNNATLVLTRVG
ncbi:beta-ketoacyl synthase N-terminal-like domain-containing protein [Salinispora vitiensis]|uniref:beta-ketoacyl synthase N-terminal-like domain-containing protein n=1 Tax=Salinispora vitiensis TaxID=999544 RepID=UPI0003644C49|nr:beta-ketoacyl synthase N-terminal-like domain-containing protein [Salinispora vitiensis]